MKRSFTRKDALTIQMKLGGILDTSAPNHDQVRIFDCGKRVARFGVRRSSIPPAKAWDLVRCTLSKAGYLELLREHDDLHCWAGN